MTSKVMTVSLARTEVYSIQLQNVYIANCTGSQLAFFVFLDLSLRSVLFCCLYIFFFFWPPLYCLSPFDLRLLINFYSPPSAASCQREQYKQMHCMNIKRGVIKLTTQTTFVPDITIMVGFVVRRVPLVKQELNSLLEHPSPPLVFLVVFVLLGLQFSVLCFVDHCLSFL